MSDLRRRTAANSGFEPLSGQMGRVARFAASRAEAAQARLKVRTCRPVLLTTATPAGGLLCRRVFESGR